MYLSMTNNNRLAGQVNNVPGGKIIIYIEQDTKGNRKTRRI